MIIFLRLGNVTTLEIYPQFNDSFLSVRHGCILEVPWSLGGSGYASLVLACRLSQGSCCQMSALALRADLMLIADECLQLTRSGHSRATRSASLWTHGSWPLGESSSRCNSAVAFSGVTTHR